MAVIEAPVGADHFDHFRPFGADGSQRFTNLEVSPTQIGEPTGTELFEQYLTARDQAALVSKIDGRRLAYVKRRVGRFLEGNNLLDGSYAEYSEGAVVAKWGGISNFLRRIAPEIDDVEHKATDLFRQAAFMMYGETPEGDEKHQDGDASFAFAVPIRMDRRHPEYGYEVESVLPLLRYVPEEMRGRVVKGLPPAIIDVYRRSEDGKRGYLVFTPVYGDEGIDLMKAARPWRLAAELVKDGTFPTAARMRRLGAVMVGGFRQRANERIVDATNFATRRLGADVVGLGAVLPGLTRFGTSLETDKTTTGHGGTIKLILDTLHETREQNIGRASVAKTIAVAGLGSIGLSIADVIAQDQLKGEGGAGRTLIIIDKDKRKTARAQAHLAKLGIEGTVRVEHDMAKTLEESDIVISAITEKLNLGKLRHKRKGLLGKLGVPGRKPDLTGLVVIDDGQPGSVIRQDAEDNNVNLAWVLGRGYNGTDELVRSSFRFGVDIKDVFGCEAEVASIAAYVREIRAAGATEDQVAEAVKHFTIRGPVNPELVSRIAQLFSKYHIGAAPLQSYGQPLDRVVNRRYRSRDYQPRHSVTVSR